MTDHKKLVRKAVKALNPMKVLSEENVPSKIELRSGETVHLTQSYATHLDATTSEWVYRLWEKNMRESYAKSDWGFDEKDKRAELMSTTSRYLIYWTEDKKPVAYVHYRFDMDNGYPVVYCYELQVETTYQRNGLARHLVSILEKLAKAYHMQKLVATVFKTNTASNEFFNALSFTKDETDPSLFENGRSVDYNIYSKLC